MGDNKVYVKINSTLRQVEEAMRFVSDEKKWRDCLEALMELKSSLDQVEVKDHLAKIISYVELTVSELGIANRRRARGQGLQVVTTPSMYNRLINEGISNFRKSLANWWETIQEG